MSEASCEETLNIYDLEGFALAGLVKESSYIDCGKNKVRIILTLVDGKIVCSECLEKDIAELSKRVIEFYKVNKIAR